MELRHLRYFLMIAETENVRRASENLHVTQPALSRQLQDLERELGVELFERLPRGLRLSAAGKSYRAEVSRLMELLAAAGERARRVAAGEAGHLKLGYVEITVWEGVVPDVLQAFTIAYPDTCLELVPADTLCQLKAIEDNELDGGFAYPIGSVPETVVAQPVRSGDVVIAFPTTWSDRIPTDPSLRDFAAFPFVGFPRERYPAHYDRILAACRAAGFSPHFVQQGNSENSILSLVSAGVGVAIVNDANSARPPALVRFARVRDLSLSLNLHFIFRTDNSNPALRVFIDTLQACLASRSVAEHE